MKEILDAELTKAADALHRFLRGLGWPVEPVAIWDRLRHEKEPRAVAAMHAIELIRKTRAAVKNGHQEADAAAAALAALHLGIITANLGIQLHEQRKRKDAIAAFSRWGVEAKRSARDEFIRRVQDHFAAHPRHSNRRAAVHFLPRNASEKRLGAMAKKIGRARRAGPK